MCTVASTRVDAATGSARRLVANGRRAVFRRRRLQIRAATAAAVDKGRAVHRKAPARGRYDTVIATVTAVCLGALLKVLMPRGNTN